MISLIVRFIIILLVLAILITLIYLFVNHNQVQTNSPTSLTISDVAQLSNDNLKAGGVFLVGINDINDDVLLYRDISNEYYLVGSCSDCPSGCANGEYLTDVNQFIACSDLPSDKKNLCSQEDRNNPNKFVKLQAMSAVEYTQSLLEKANGKKLDINQCIQLVDLIPNQSTNLANELALASAQATLDSNHQSFWDYLASRKEQLIETGSTFISFTLLSKVMGEYAMIFMMAPLMTTSAGRYNAGIMTGYMISHSFWNKMINGSLKTALESITTQTEEKIASETSDAMFEFAIRESTVIVEKTITRIAAEALISVIEMADAILNPVFLVIDILMLVGMILDALDPCGLQNTLSEDDLLNISNSFHHAFFVQTLASFRTYPVEWFAEFVPDYGLNCQLQKKEKVSLSEKTLNLLARDDNKYLFINNMKSINMKSSNMKNSNLKNNVSNDCSTSDDPCCSDNDLKVQYQSEYYNALKINSLGQCIVNVDNNFIYNKLKELGLTVDKPPSDWPKPNQAINSSSFNKLIDYLSIKLANDNVVVAGFISTYWYLILALLVAMAVIIYLL